MKGALNCTFCSASLLFFLTWILPCCFVGLWNCLFGTSIFTMLFPEFAIFWYFWSMQNSYVIHNKCLKRMRRLSFFLLLGRKVICDVPCIHRVCVFGNQLLFFSWNIFLLFRIILYQKEWQASHSFMTEHGSREFLFKDFISSICREQYCVIQYYCCKRMTCVSFFIVP